MTLPGRDEWLFSIKSFAGAMLALYVALRIGLPRPFWSMLTAYVVANPLAGPVRSKALYRVGGTFLGSAATVLLVPSLATAPELLTLALALWVALCLYISLQDRTPRSYAFMLAGYTAALIGFPAVSDPGGIFDIALARVEEITLGIVSATLVHSLVFPRSLGPVLLARLDQAVADSRRWMRDALHGETIEGEARDRRKLAGDMTELRLMSTHLPFDTSHLRWTSETVRALQDRLSALVPLLSGVEDRVRELRKLAPVALDATWTDILERIETWTAKDVRDAGSDAAEMASLRAAIAAAGPSVGKDMSWPDALQINLAARLGRLVEAWGECRRLRWQLEDGVRGRMPSGGFGTTVAPRALHRDRGLALLSAFAAVVAIVACTAFWILTAWPAGSAAPMMAAVFCCFFATQDDPAPGIMTFLTFTIWSIPASALYLLGILPAVHHFETLALVIAPMFLILGTLVAQPATSGKAMAFLFGVAGTLSMQDTGTADLVSFINSMLGQLFGIAAAVLVTRLTRTVSAEWTARRLLQAGWRELASLGRSARAPSVAEM
ncbi:FUSC family protein, partial [Oxalobacteraceae bacterium OM1]